MRNRVWIALMILGAGLLLFILIKYFSYYTPHVQTDNGAAFMEEISLDGQKQTILVRTNDLSKPMIIFLHGGPGMPMMYLAHSFQRELEKHLVIIHWDQLGAGKSYSDDINPDLMNVDQFIRFTRDLTVELKNRFGKKKVILAGHSWGSYVGILTVKRYPELFSGFISIGQVVDNERAVEIQKQFIIEQANIHNKPHAISEIEEKGHAVFEKWLFEFGGELYGKTNYWPFILTGIMAPEYSIQDIRKIPKGSQFSSNHMNYNVLEKPVMEALDSLEVPVFFFIGRHDYTTPFELVEEFYEKVKAPRKEIIWFENSAHFPFFEEPDQFNRNLVQITYSLDQ